MKNPARERAFRIGYHISQNCGGDEVIASPPCLIRFAHRHTNVCLSAAVRTLNFGFESRNRQHKNQTPVWAFYFCGGDEGIRTLDTVARIPHFQCGALDQLCDISGFYELFFVARIIVRDIFGDQFRRIFRIVGNQCFFQFCIDFAQCRINTVYL